MLNLKNLDIRNADVSDAPAILELQKVAYQSEAELHNDFNIPPLTQTLEELCEDFHHKTILKVMDDERLIGSGQVRYDGVSHSSHIGRMAIRPELQGQGIGTKLMSTLESIYPEAKRIEIFTGEHSVANLTMYQRRGYQAFKQLKLGNTTVIFLEKFI